MRGDMKAIAGKAIVPLRERPTSGTALDDELLYGMVVEVLEEAADEEEGEAVPWVSVRTPYRYTGYCKKEDLILDQARVAAWEAGELCVVMQGFADVLDEPRVQGVCLESLARGGRLLAHREEATEEAGWVCVELADGGRIPRRSSWAPVTAFPLRRTRMRSGSAWWRWRRGTWAPSTAGAGRAH